MMEGMIYPTGTKIPDGTRIRVLNAGIGAERVNNQIAYVVSEDSSASHGLLSNDRNSFCIRVANDIWRVSSSGSYKNEPPPKDVKYQQS